MTTRVRVVRSRWWAVLLRLIALMLLGFLLSALWFAVFRDFSAPSFLSGFVAIAFAAILLLAVVLLVGTLRYRVEVGSEGFRVVSLYGARDFYWSEIEEIFPRPNFRAPGWHVGFQVDGSLNPPRTATNLWMRGHHIAPGMEMGGIEFSNYLRRRWNEWQRRNRAQTTVNDQGI